VLSDIGADRTPDQRHGVPVKVRLISEQVLCVDSENRAIITSVGENSVTTFLVDGGHKPSSRIHATTTFGDSSRWPEDRLLTAAVQSACLRTIR
jgi:hypothetical protein